MKFRRKLNFALVLCASLFLFSGMAFSMEISSEAFGGGEEILEIYTGVAEDLSPPLSWKDAPEGTKTFALIMDDPDAPAGIWVHWVIYNIPAYEKNLKQGIPKSNRLADGSMQGMNSFRKIGYGGPNPPPGPAHRYIFKLYALDTALNLSPGASKEEVESAMKGHVLAEAQLTGMFGR